MTYPNPHDQDPFSRKHQIDRLRATQHGKSDWDTFDSFFDKVESNVNFKPKRTFAKFAGIALLVNLLFWGTLIVLAAWALGHFVF